MNLKNITFGIVLLLFLVGASFFIWKKTQMDPQPNIKVSDEFIESQAEQQKNKEVGEADDEEKVEADPNILNTPEELKAYEEAQAKEEKILEEKEEARAASVQNEIDQLKADLEAAKKQAAEAKKPVRKKVVKTIPAELDAEGNVLVEERQEETIVEMPAEEVPVVNTADLEDQIRLKVDELEYPPLATP